jgi:hypothetical protein
LSRAFEQTLTVDALRDKIDDRRARCALAVDQLQTQSKLQAAAKQLETLINHGKSCPSLAAIG